MKKKEEKGDFIMRKLFLMLIGLVAISAIVLAPMTDTFAKKGNKGGGVRFLGLGKCWSSN